MATYFVRKSGSDNNNGLTKYSAFLTINRAEAAVQPGDTVWIGKGKYDEMLTRMTAGTALQRIRFIADTTGEMTGDAGPVIVSGSDGDNTTFQRTSCVKFRGKGFVTYDGITWYGDDMFDSSDVHTEGVIIRRGSIFLNPVGGKLCLVAAGKQFPSIIFEGNFMLVPGNAGSGSTTSFSMGVAGKHALFLGNFMVVTSNVGFFGANAGGSTYIVLHKNIIFSSELSFMYGDASAYASENIAYSLAGATFTDTFFGTATIKSGNIYGLPYFNVLHPGLFTNLGALSPVNASTASRWLSQDDSVPASPGEGRTRPSTGAQDIGPIQHDPTISRETDPVDEGTYSASVAGFGFLDFDLPVASSGNVTVTARLRKNTSYVGNAPTAHLSQLGERDTPFNLLMETGDALLLETGDNLQTDVRPDEELLLSNLLMETGDALLTEDGDNLLLPVQDVFTEAADTWETLTLTATMVAQGVARLRVRSYSTDTAGKLYVDNITVT